MLKMTLRCPVPGYVYIPGDVVPVAADVRGLDTAVVEFEVNGTSIARDDSELLARVLTCRSVERQTAI